MAGYAGAKEKLQLCTNHGNATVQNFGTLQSKILEAP